MLVSSIERNAPSEDAGLEPGDVILMWNKVPYSDPTLLSRAIAASPIGFKIPIDIIRSEPDGPKKLQLTVTVESMDHVATKRWRLNLDVLEAEMDHIIGFPEITGQFENPTLFLSGGASDYVRPEHRPLIKSLFSAARFAKIPNAGQWLHAERPREFEAAVRAYLDA